MLMSNSIGLQVIVGLSWLALDRPACKMMPARGFQQANPFLDAAFPQLEKLTAKTLWPAFNAIRKPSLIRVEADEAQYPMHIILRFVLSCGCLSSLLLVVRLAVYLPVT